MSILSWLETFGKILVCPTKATYLEESQKSKNKTVDAYIWLVLLTPGLYLARTLAHDIPLPPIYGLILISLLLPLGFLFFVFCVNFLIKKFVNLQKDIHAELLYLLTSNFFISAILAILSLFIPLPYGTYLGWVIIVYLTILNVITIQALARLRIWQILIVLLIGTILGLGGALCLPIFILSTNNAVQDITFGW